MSSHKSRLLNRLLRVVIVCALALMVVFASELGLLLDAAFVDLFVIVFASSAVAHFSILRSALALTAATLRHARISLERTLLARPSAFCLTVCLAGMSLLLPGTRSAAIGFLLPALVPDWRPG